MKNFIIVDDEGNAVPHKAVQCTSHLPLVDNFHNMKNTRVEKKLKDGVFSIE